MAKDKTKLLSSFSTVLCYVTFIPLVFGVLIQKDGISIIADHKKYKAGILKGDSLETLIVGKSNRTAIFLDGHVDTVQTSILIGHTRTLYTDSILGVYARTGSALIPVWYKADGEDTIERFANEKEFPLWRIAKKTLLYLLSFCGPFVLAIIWRYRLKRTIAKSKDQAKS